MVGATLAIPFLITPALCMEDDDPSKGYIISTIFFVSGIVTLLQSTFGCRYDFYNYSFMRVATLIEISMIIVVKLIMITK